MDVPLPHVASGIVGKPSPSAQDEIRSFQLILWFDVEGLPIGPVLRLSVHLFDDSEFFKDAVDFALLRLA
jgi:hypothetical protein